MRRMDAKDGQPKEVLIAQSTGKPGKTHRSPGDAIIASKTKRAKRYEFQDEDAFTRSALFTGRVKSRLFPIQASETQQVKSNATSKSSLWRFRRHDGSRKSSIIIRHQT